MGIFKKRQYGIITIPVEDVNIPVVPDGTWVKCNSCGKLLYKKNLVENFNICNNCGNYFRLGAYERVETICDKDSFIEFGKNIKTNKFLDFPKYKEKLKANIDKSGLNEAVITGECLINGFKAIIAVMDSNFMMGSMGTVVGDKIAVAVEEATRKKLPIIIFTTSGGARMQEGIFSLMQMAKISSALSKHSDEGLLYITVLTDPTTGGVTASFAMLGDIILSEPKALIGFAGRRVIEGTLKETLPDDFQTAEFLLERGFIDSIVKREELRKTLSTLLRIHNKGKGLTYGKKA